MGWIYDIEYTNNGKPITVKVGIKNPKEVPGALVHWIDTRGDIHHSYVAIYTRGALKDKPKSTVHGCLDKNREPILKIGKEGAKELLYHYNSALRRYKKNPGNYDDLSGKTGAALNTAARKKANEYAIKQATYFANRKAEIQNPAKLLSNRKGTIMYNDAYDEDGKGKMRIAVGGDQITNDELKLFSKHGKKLLRNFDTGLNRSVKYMRQQNLIDLLNKPKSANLPKKPKRKSSKKSSKTKSTKEQPKVEAKKVFVASKPWSAMTNEEKINHAKKVLNIENPAAMTAVKNSKMRNRDKNNAILQKYDSLSDDVKNNHLP